MPTITLKRINRQIVLNSEDFEWLKDNLNKPIQLSGIDYDRDGKLVYVTIYMGNKVTVLFLNCGKNEYVLRNVHPRR